jgi:hypothetical protein
LSQEFTWHLRYETIADLKYMYICSDNKYKAK